MCYIRTFSGYSLPQAKIHVDSTLTSWERTRLDNIGSGLEFLVWPKDVMTGLPCWERTCLDNIGPRFESLIWP